MDDKGAPPPLSDPASLRQRTGEPVAHVATKAMPRLDKHCRHFIALSPFLCLGTMDVDGKADVSPRGDPPGFVTVLDDRTILISDRPGNRRADSMQNILTNPSVGLLFLVPGIEETLRLNGRASVIEDPALLASMAERGKAPKLAIRVEIEEVYFHCAKPLIRSRLWDPMTRIERGEFPRYGEIIRDKPCPTLTPRKLRRGSRRVTRRNSIERRPSQPASDATHVVPGGEAELGLQIALFGGDAAMAHDGENRLDEPQPPPAVGVHVDAAVD